MLEPDENNQNREARRQNIGRKIWTSMLDADLNARYWKYIRRRVQPRTSKAKECAFGSSVVWPSG